MTNVERWAYIRAERAKTPPKGYSELGRELGIDPSHVIRLARMERPPTRDTTPIKLEPGKEYWLVTFLGAAATPPGKKGRYGRFRCRCGTECVRSIAEVARGNNTSCGCQANWESCRGRPFDHVCVMCRKPFKGGPTARVCGIDCKRARWRQSYAARRRQGAEAGGEAKTENQPDTGVLSASNE